MRTPTRWLANGGKCMRTGVANCSILLRLCKNLSKKKQKNKKIKVEMASNTQVAIEEKIQEQKGQSPFEKGKQIKKIPNPLGGINDQKAKSFEDPNQNDVLKDEVEKFITDEGLDLGGERYVFRRDDLILEREH
jgi:hypothetical protein